MESRAGARMHTAWASVALCCGGHLPNRWCVVVSSSLCHSLSRLSPMQPHPPGFEPSVKQQRGHVHVSNSAQTARLSTTCPSVPSLPGQTHNLD